MDEIPESCSLDVAERGGVTLDRLGVILRLTRERVRQLIVASMLKAKDSPEILDRPDGFEPLKPVPKNKRKGGPGPRPSDGIGLEERCSQVLDFLRENGPSLSQNVQKSLGVCSSRHFRIVEVLRRRELIVKLDYYTLALPDQTLTSHDKPISKRAAESIARGRGRILAVFDRYKAAATSTIAEQAGMSYVRTCRVLNAMQAEGTVLKDGDGRWTRV